MFSSIGRFLRRRVIKAKLFGYDLIHTINPQYGYKKSDIILAGFPKSGNNWVTFLIANTIVRAAGRDDDIHFRNANDWVSSTFPASPPADVDGIPRFVATHDNYKHQEANIIYILRHPADVMESYYHYLGGRWNEPVGEFSEFIRSDQWGVRAWKRHVESWDGHRNVLIKFEDLKRDPKAQLKEICDLFDRDISEKELEYAVTKSSFENMSRMEERYGLPQKHGANQDYVFMRSGESNLGAEYFCENDYRYLWQEASEVMKRYDYDVPTNS